MEIKIPLLLVLLVLAHASTTPPSIISISSSPTSQVTPVYSSLRGGTYIYIKAKGHSPDPTDNLVYVGIFPCQIPQDGVTDTFITCQTTETGLYENLKNMPVTLISYGLSVTTSSPYVVHFTTGSTPELKDVFPSAAIGGQYVNFYGTHRVSDIGDGLLNMGDVEQLRLGDDLCSRFDIEAEEIKSNQDQYIKCKKSSTQEAGLYNVTEQVVPGFANKSRYMRRSSLDPKQYFEFASLPTVSSVSPATGNIGGQYLTISGSGFSLNPKNNTVTVDGNDCSVTSATNDKILCTLASRDTSLSSQLATNSSNQVNGFFSGAGLKYARYTVTTSIDSLSQLTTAVRNADTTALGTPNEEGYRADLREASVYDENEAQAWRGYFTAPVAGQYTFRMTADDRGSFYLASDYGSEEPPATPLLETNVHQYMFNHFLTNPGGQEAKVTLEAGKSYYMEAYHINYGWTGFFNLAVQVPNTDTSALFQTYQVDNISLSSTVQSEEYRYSIIGENQTGTIQLRRYEVDSSFKVIVDESVNITYGCTASQFQNAIDDFDIWKNYQITVTRTILDSGNNVLADTNGAATIHYDVSAYLLRSADHQSKTLTITNFDGFSGSVTQAQTTPHSDLVTGTFTLSIAGVAISVGGSTDLSYNVEASALQAAIRSSTIVGFDEIEVIKGSSHGCGYKCWWMIQYKGFNQAVPSITVSGASLSGGVGSPLIEANTRRAYSSNIEFDPIDFRFLNTVGSTHSVLVQTNGVPSVCTGNCGYTFDTFTQITALSYSGSTLSLSLSDPQTINFAINTITITVGDQPCSVDGGSTLASLTCTMATNTDGTPILVAGQVTPVVKVGTYGIANLYAGRRRLLQAITPLNVPLTTSALSVTTGGNNGGYLINLAGTGFPLDKSKISVEICGKSATIYAVNNIRVDFYVPSCGNTGAETVTVTVGSLTDTSQSFTYTDGSATAPTITQLSPSSSNPAIKSTMQIHGDKFGTVASNVKVFLSNSTGKVYELTVLSIANNLIKVGLPGGNAGEFIVQVNEATLGDSIAGGANTNVFKYAVTIDSIATQSANTITPLSGSYNGGTLLTITGTNFNTDRQNTHVYIGHALNWFCTIQTITSTQIQCRTPAMNKQYQSNPTVTVIVATRLVVFNTCPGTCQFTYLDAASSPSLTSISSASNTVTSTKSITLTGTNLIDSSSNAQVALTHSITKEVTTFTPTSATATSVVFDLPSTVQSGNYQISVRNAIGGTNALEFEVGWNPGTASFASGGSLAGNIVKLTNGGGYGSSIDGIIFSASLTSDNADYPVNIVSCCTNNQVEIQIPAAANGTAFTLTMKGPVNSKTYTYTALESLTPTGQRISADPTDLSQPNEITINLTNNVPISSVNSISLVSVIDSTSKIDIAANSWTLTGSGINQTISFNTSLKTGAYNIVITTSPNGNIQLTNGVNGPFPSGVTGPATQQISFNGGQYTITADNLSPASYITVNGLRGDILTSSASAVTYQVPAFVTADTEPILNEKPAILPSNRFTFIADHSDSNVSAAFDDKADTHYGSTNSVCYFGVDAGQSTQVSLHRVKIFGNLQWKNVARKILHATIEGSNDNSNWNVLARIDQTIKMGSNFVKTNDTTGYRYIRFHHNTTSQCNIAQFKLIGLFYSATPATLSSTNADVIYYDGHNTQTYANALQFRQDHTAVVTDVSPKYGVIAGGQTLTITGQYLDTGAVTVTIDGVECTGATASSATTITCTTGARSSTYTQDNTFSVRVGASNAILKAKFLYALKWSDQSTWGVDSPPVANDLIYVPKGTTLLVDQDTPILEGIAVEGGTLAFSDDLDLKVEAGFIIMNGGRFIAGTETNPHQHKLTFIMHGGYYGKQMPIFGNKGIGCNNCKFSMYGKPRDKTWTTLAATINAGDTTLTLTDSVDWQVGQEIAVASTTFVHEQSENRIITAISGTSVTVDKAFEYQHVSVDETHGGKTLNMRAEVGLLTRNIKMMGESQSEMRQYGSHLLLHGQAQNGFEGHVAYSEFQHCGQPQIRGRYCIHFHMAGDVPTSFVRGNAVHDSFARITTIHGVHYLTVEHNVGFRIKGHNFFVEDGIETHNTIRYNLAISSIQTTRMLQTDTSVASFWITNPTNDVYGNHAAGGDFYGIWYELKEHPDGASATQDVCPQHNPLGNVYNNTAHSNKRFGLRLDKFFTLLYPCGDEKNQTNYDNIWAHNPSEESKFYNFTIYKNLEDGVLAQETGHVVFDDFVIAENFWAGVQFFENNFTQISTVLQNSVIIGKSNTNFHPTTTNYTNNMSAIITGKTGVHVIKDVHIANYPIGSLVFQTCRFCDDPLKYTNLGTEVEISGVTFDNVHGKMLRMIGFDKRCVIYDLDGSLSNKFDGQSRASGTIVHGWPHIIAQNSDTCKNATNASDWQNSTYCDPTVTIRRIWFTNLQDKQAFNSQNMSITEIAAATDVIPQDLNSVNYTKITSIINKISPLKKPKKELADAWGIPFIAGKIYNIWWGTGIDFSHLSLVSTARYADTDPGIVFKFNYTENRQLFEIGPMRGGARKLNDGDFINALGTDPVPATCNNGEYYRDNSNDTSLRRMTICQSGKNKAKYQYTQVNGIICKYLCPLPSGTFIKEDFIRDWSNATQWPGGVVPQAGDNVTLNGNWTVVMDIDPNPLGYFIIDGTLIAKDNRDTNLTADSIFIRAGNLTAGSKASPFLHKFTIQVNGNKSDVGQVIDPIVAGNKFFVVTGILNIHGVSPANPITTLAEGAAAGATTIKVNADISDWKQGDQIAISPSFNTATEYQSKTITAINTADKIITLDSALAHTHYGDSGQTINNHYGKLDTRARVAHLTRNIKVVPGPDEGWGYTIHVYGFLDGDITRVGAAMVSGVEFYKGGQYDSMKYGLVFLNVLNGNYTSELTDNSFHNCQAGCLLIKNSEKISFSGNTFFKGYQYLVQTTSTIKSVTFNDNLMIGVMQKYTLPAGYQLVACIYVETNVLSSQGVSIKNNYCLGSPRHGFAVPFQSCGDFQANPIANNTAGSTDIGFIINTNGAQCQAFSYAKAFASNIGQISGSPGIVEIKFDHFIMADNGRGVTLKLGAKEGGNDHNASLYNSYITAVSRPNCDYCYGSSATRCNGRLGVRMFTASANGEVMPAKFGHSFDVVCKQPVYDSKSFIHNTTFDNFKQSYTQSGLSGCMSNFVFRPHSGGFDMTGGANLFNSKCVDCDTSSYLTAPAPSPSRLGWFGGCGDILCTGFNNYLVQDHTGDFLGFEGTIVANNSVIGDNQAGCTHNSVMNSHVCTRSDFAALEYESRAKDFQTRIMWPVYLKYDGGSYQTVTNGWSEWQWLGDEPRNKRFGRFVSLIKLNQTYNMTYASMPPQKLRVQIQRRTQAGDNNNYIRVKLHYPKPNTISIKVNGIPIDPILLTNVNNSATGVLKQLDNSQCGSHYYFYTNYTTQFVVTEDPDCLVLVELSQSVQLTTHFSIDINDFFNSNNAITNFINNLAALLQITDTSRIKVVGVHSGSTVIVTAITNPPAGSNDTTTAAQVATNANQPSVSAGLGNIGLGNVIGFTATYQPLDDDEESDDSSTNIGLIVGIVLASVILVVGAIVTVVCCMRRRAKVVEGVVTNEEFVEADVKEEKSGYFFNPSENADVPNDSEVKIKGRRTKQDVLKVNQVEDNSEIISN